MATKGTVLAGVSNDASETIAQLYPYMIEARIEGASPVLFHRWSCEDVEAKASAAKGSKAKKEDNVESYLYRNERGEVAIPAEYFRMSMVNAAKFKQDPRSPRKSAMDLFKAGIATIGDLCSLGTKEPDYMDRRRVVIQRNGITRVRPAMMTGWKCQVALQILLPEYITPALANEVLQYAGRIVGVGDFRPSFGRFQVTGFDVIELR